MPDIAYPPRVEWPTAPFYNPDGSPYEPVTTWPSADELRAEGLSPDTGLPYFEEERLYRIHFQGFDRRRIEYLVTCTATRAAGILRELRSAGCRDVRIAS